MPPPGEQHLQSGGRTFANPFEEVKPRISEYTAQEIATLQSRLEKQLGPEYISSRAGPSGQKVHYIAAEKCIQLANEIFGFNGWSSQIMDVQVDFVDENPTNQKVSLGLSVIVRVTLRDGTFHEDVGYGHMENAKGKAAAFEKAKKEGTTDALKRALRNFGNVLGNCIYDKDYLAKVTKVKTPPVRWDVENLHRHSTSVPLPLPKKEDTKGLDEKPVINGGPPSLATEDTLDDEFGEFDEADFSVADSDINPDEVVLPGPTVTSNHFPNPRSANTGPPQNQARNFNRPQQQQNAAPRPQISAQHATTNSAPHPQQNPTQRQQVPAQQAPTNNASYPQTPNSGFARSHLTSERPMPPPHNMNPQTRAAMQPGTAGPPPVIQGRTLNQPSRLGPTSAPPSPARHDDSSNIESFGLPPPGAGFFSARAAAAVLPTESVTTDPSEPPPPIPNNLAAFNPHAESPSIRKTPGVDHRTSKPLARDGKHVPAVQGGAVGAGRGALDGVRRIGAPNSPSPMANKSSYKAPTMIKRPAEQQRAPLVDLPANGAITGAGSLEGGDAKRQRLSGT